MLFFAIIPDLLCTDGLCPKENTNLSSVKAVLKKYLVEKDSNGQTSRCIIFVTTRILAKALTSFINTDSSLSHLNAAVYTGSNAPDLGKSNF